mmetsp:Transcript_28801/g.78032  ORF Transcript_28801/g.78032 Transcript_28801/m.78032 type:complete len:149 (-) Transcript_28801:137-583(-)
MSAKAAVPCRYSSERDFAGAPAADPDSGTDRAPREPATKAPLARRNISRRDSGSDTAFSLHATGSSVQGSADNGRAHAVGFGREKAPTPPSKPLQIVASRIRLYAPKPKPNAEDWSLMVSCSLISHSLKNATWNICSLCGQPTKNRTD